MREILFRGKRKDNGEWVDGNYMRKDNPCIEEPTFWCAFIQNRALSMYEAIPKTIGQFTGLIDKNGTQIFEGDVLRIHHNKEYTRPLNCEWDESNACFCYVDVADFGQKYYLGGSELSMDEVIGNIHDK